MALLYAGYFDASRRSRVLSVGGLVAPVSKMVRLERHWLEVLAEFGVKAFHMTDFASRKGEFEGWSNAKRHAMFDKLIVILKNNSNKLIAANVELDEWHRLNASYELEEVWGHPYAMCGIAAIAQVKKWASSKGIKTRIEYIFEDGDEGKGALIDRCKDEGIEPVFRSKTLAVPCQAADLIAWKHSVAMISARDLTEGDVEGLNAILKSLAQIKVRPTSGGIFSGEMLRKMCREVPNMKRGSIVAS